MKALLIDDHSLVRDGIEILLTIRLGFDSVYHAENGAQALACLAQDSLVDLVLLDYKLGEESGLTVLAQIKALYPTLKVAMMSGEDQAQPIVQALGEGALGFIPKNLSSQDLAQAIQLVLDGQIFVPKLKDTKAVLQVDEAVTSAQRQIAQIAELARRVIRDKDFSQRIELGESSEVTSAFNSLLEELQQDRSRLQQLAFTDELTGLANRRLFLDRAEQGLRHAKRTKSLTGLLYLDLDSFKQLNDAQGHDAGDQVLKEVGARLKAGIREVDTAARLGGDEFTAVLLDISNEASAQDLVARVFNALIQPIALEGGATWSPEASIGVALTNGEATLQDVMNRADALMYRVKQGGKNQFIIEGEN